MSAPEVLPSTVAVRLTVTLQSDLHIGELPTTDTVRRTRGHIPGAVLRGAYAKAWLDARIGGRAPAVPAAGSLRDEFVDLFEGGVRFGPLYFGEPATRLSLLCHKYKPRPQCVEVWDQAETAHHDRRDGLRCRDCDQPLEPAKGEIEQPLVTRRGHVEREENGTAKDGALFSRQSVRRVGNPNRPTTEFTGRLVAGRQDQLDQLTALRPSLGGRRTSHGLVRIDSAVVAENLPPVDAAGRFVMTLNSPAIFVDDSGYPLRMPRPAELADALGVPATVVRCWTRWGEEGGWHAASGLPKHNELVAAAGSTYLVEAPGVDAGGLAALWRRGLGLRRYEGFGDLR